MAAIEAQVLAEILKQVPAYSTSGNPEILPELEEHVREYLAALLRLSSGAESADLEFVHAHAQRRAAQRFPLEATLQSYRVAEPIIDEWLEARKAPRARAREFANSVSYAFASEYVSQTRVLAEAEGDRRTELLGILLSGYDESDQRVGRLLKRAGYLEQRRSFCVAVAQSTDPLEMENPARALRIVEAMTKAVAESSIRSLIGLRGNLVTAVYSDQRRASGWTAPQGKLADRLGPLLLELGPAVLIGLSSDQPSTSFIPRGLQEASVALDFAGVAHRLVQFSELPIRRLLIHRGADYVQSALPTWFPLLRDADAKAKGALFETLRALADADMNVQGAARALAVHPNTLYARIQRIQELTGLDAQRYNDLTNMLLAADCHQG